jgi:hypothetical protein
MAVNYDDERFTQVENEKQSELDKYNQTYDALIDERNQFTNQQQDLVDQWENTQKQIANDNLNYQIEQYNQQKEDAEKDYQKEAKASYIDYQKEVDKYGVSRENVVANGLSNSGYAESSKVDMYNTYQNRIATARESLNDIKLEFDNAIKEAQLANNATLAENALTALQQKLEIALEGFNYKDTATQNKLTWENTINNTYYDRYKDVESQINYENEQAEAIRQYNENLALQKEQLAQAQAQWEKEFAYQQQQDAISNAQKWASINSSSSSSSSSGTSGATLTDESSSGDLFGNNSSTTSRSDYYFSNGYQPQYINNNKLNNKSGLKVSDIFADTAPVSGSQKIWSDGTNYYVWLGNGNKGGEYVDVTSQVNESVSKKVCLNWG